MRRNCNLELRFVPYSDSGNHHHHHHQQHQHMPESSSESPQQLQQLTIFYNGSVCVCDVTEIQARAIMWLASREMEADKLLKTPTGSEPPSPTLPSQLHSPSAPTGLSMKRSLQRFLQKRKHRIQATSPYNH